MLNIRRGSGPVGCRPFLVDAGKILRLHRQTKNPAKTSGHTTDKKSGKTLRQTKNSSIRFFRIPFFYVVFDSPIGNIDTGQTHYVPSLSSRDPSPVSLQEESPFFIPSNPGTSLTPWAFSPIAEGESPAQKPDRSLLAVLSLTHEPC